MANGVIIPHSNIKTREITVNTGAYGNFSTDCPISCIMLAMMIKKTGTTYWYPCTPYYSESATNYSGYAYDVLASGELSTDALKNLSGATLRMTYIEQ